MNGPFNKIGAFTFAVGVELQVVGGGSVTVTVANFQPDSAELEVQSTLGFPPSGYLLIGDVSIYYGSKSVWKFTDLVVDHFNVIPEMSRVELATRRQTPDAYELFWSYPWAGNDYNVEL